MKTLNDVQTFVMRQDKRLTGLESAVDSLSQLQAQQGQSSLDMAARSFQGQQGQSIQDMAARSLQGQTGQSSQSTNDVQALLVEFKDAIKQELREEFEIIKSNQIKESEDIKNMIDTFDKQVRSDIADNKQDVKKMLKESQEVKKMLSESQERNKNLTEPSTADIAMGMTQVQQVVDKMETNQNSVLRKLTQIQTAISDVTDRTQNLPDAVNTTQVQQVVDRIEHQQNSVLQKLDQIQTSISDVTETTESLPDAVREVKGNTDTLLDKAERLTNVTVLMNTDVKEEVSTLKICLTDSQSDVQEEISSLKTCLDGKLTSLMDDLKNGSDITHDRLYKVEQDLSCNRDVINVIKDTTEKSSNLIEENNKAVKFGGFLHNTIRQGICAVIDQVISENCINRGILLKQKTPRTGQTFHFYVYNFNSCVKSE